MYVSFWSRFILVLVSQVPLCRSQMFIGGSGEINLDGSGSGEVDDVIDTGSGSTDEALIASDELHAGIIAAIFLAIVILVLVILICCIYCREKCYKQKSYNMGGRPPALELRKHPIQSIQNGFHRPDPVESYSNAPTLVFKQDYPTNSYPTYDNPAFIPDGDYRGFLPDDDSIFTSITNDDVFEEPGQLTSNGTRPH